MNASSRAKSMRVWISARRHLRRQGRQKVSASPRRISDLRARSRRVGRTNVRAKRLDFTTDLSKPDADAVFIAVGTPSRRGEGHPIVLCLRCRERRSRSRSPILPWVNAGRYRRRVECGHQCGARSRLRHAGARGVRRGQGDLDRLCRDGKDCARGCRAGVLRLVRRRLLRGCGNCPTRDAQGNAAHGAAAFEDSRNAAEKAVTTDVCGGHVARVAARSSDCTRQLPGGCAARCSPSRTCRACAARRPGSRPRPRARACSRTRAPGPSCRPRR
ncbi:hypothetical protein ACVIIW_003674 [Bradyrhizobium sp. USDA 4449]